MGQLEKYGLYVLCLVIFLILGVAIWGGGDVPPQGARRQAQGGDVTPLRGGGEVGSGNENVVHASSVADLLGLGGNRGAGGQDGPKGAQQPKVAPAEQPQPDPKADNPVPAPGPVASNVRPTHKVVSGDTFESIAKGLGSAALVADIKKLNPKVEPSKMAVGTELILPSPAEVEARRGGGRLGGGSAGGGSASPVNASATKGDAANHQASGKRTHVIVKGDTLERIARKELGDFRRVDELRKLNPGVDDRNLKVGRALILPAK